MSSSQLRSELLSKLQSDVDGMLITAAAYQAKAIKEELTQRPNASAAERALALEHILSAPGGDMTAAQAKRFAAQYEPVAALDAKGAGAVVFRDRADQALVVGVRGSDFANNFGPDVAADRDLAVGKMPLTQMAEIASFLARTTAPKGQAVPQFGVRTVETQTGNSSPVTLANPASALLGKAGEPKIPELYVSGQAKGEGSALGICKIGAAHSKGGPQSLVVSGLLQCAHTTTYNAPQLPIKDLQKIVDMVGHSLGQNPTDIATLQRTALVGSGPKIVAGLHAPEGALLDTLVIPQSLNPMVNHGVVNGLRAATERMQIAQSHPELTTLAQVDQRMEQRLSERPVAPAVGAGLKLTQAANEQLQKLAEAHDWGAAELQAFAKAVAKEAHQNHAGSTPAHAAVPHPERPHSPTPGQHRLH